MHYTIENTLVVAKHYKQKHKIVIWPFVVIRDPMVLFVRLGVLISVSWPHSSMGNYILST